MPVERQLGLLKAAFERTVTNAGTPKRKTPAWRGFLFVRERRKAYFLPI